MRFHNQVVIVTGGSKGIGEGCARVFCAEGGKVALLARGAEAGEELERELNDCGPGEAAFFPCDVTRLDQLESAVAQTVRRFGRIDCLINDAGWHPPATTIDATTIADMESLLRLNFLSTFAATKFAVPHLRKTKGTVINVASIVAEIGQNEAAAYCATKAAQIGFTRGLAVELGPQGIRVNAILPGNIETPLMHEWASSLADPASGLARMAALQLSGKLGTIEEIGRIALFLATDDSSFITGQAIHAEFGATLDY